MAIQPDRRKNERGATLVEFAALLPLLLLLLVTVIDLGFVVHEHRILQNAAREAARFSSLPRNQISSVNPAATSSRIKDRVVEYCLEKNIAVNLADISVNQQYPILVDGLTLMGSEIRMTYERALLLGGFLPVSEVNLSGRSVFRNFY